MKKFLALILIFAMTFTFASCGEEVSKRKTKKKEKKEELVTLTWYAFGDEQRDLEEVLEAANEIIKSEINAELELKFISQSAYDEKMKMIIAAREEFDICFTSNWRNNYASMASYGSFYDISDLVSESAKLNNSIDEKYWDDMKIDGRIYAVPNIQYTMHMQLAVGVRSDLAEKYDIDINSIQHISDLTPVLTAIKNGEPEVYPYRNNLSVTPWMFDKYTDVSGGAGIYARNDNGEIVNGIETEEYVSAVKTLNEWYKKGFIRQDGNSDDILDEIRGNYGVKIEYYNPAKIQTGDYSYVYAPITEPYFLSAKSSALAVSATSKNPQKAFELIELINTNKELYNILCYGIEGKHYKLNREERAVTDSTSGYYPNSSWQFGNQFNAISPEGLTDEMLQKAKALNNKAKAIVPTAFSLNKESISIELANIAAVNAEYSDFAAISDCDAYLEDKKSALQSAGIVKVMEEIERQMEVHKSR